MLKNNRISIFRSCDYLKTVLLISLLVVSGCFANNADSKKADVNKLQLQWYAVGDDNIEGKGFSDTKHPFDRLPARAEKLVRKKVWDLSRQSAGLAVRFETDSSQIHAKWELLSDRLNMPHMPTTSVSGIDLYAKDKSGRWGWVGAAKQIKVGNNSLALVKDLDTSNCRTYIMYLPLYNGLTSLEIGVDEKASFRFLKSCNKKPIVYYGTSIVQGGCASRPGMCHTSILGRRLNQPVINLGFSGHGRMDLEIAELMAEIDASIYILDCLPNLNIPQVSERTEPFIKILQKKQKNTPILLVECPNYPRDFCRPKFKEHTTLQCAELREVYENMKKAGIENLYYLKGDNLFGQDGEGTVDGTHPTDLGFVRFADALEPVLKRIMELE